MEAKGARLMGPFPLREFALSFLPLIFSPVFSFAGRIFDKGRRIGVSGVLIKKKARGFVHEQNDVKE